MQLNLVPSGSAENLVQALGDLDVSWKHRLSQPQFLVLKESMGIGRNLEPTVQVRPLGPSSRASSWYLGCWPNSCSPSDGIRIPAEYLLEAVSQDHPELAAPCLHHSGRLTQWQSPS